MLVKRAATGDVQHLHTPADRENRNPARHRAARQGELEAIELGSVGPSSGCSAAP